MSYSEAQGSFLPVFTVFRLLTDFVCLYNYEFWLSLCKIVLSSVILLLHLFVSTCPSEEQLEQILRIAKIDQLHPAIEIEYNTLHGITPISKINFKKLSSLSRNIRKLVVTGITPQQRRCRLFKIVAVLPVLINQFSEYESRNGSDSEGEVRGSDEEN